MVSLKNRKWKEFFIEDIFFIKSGKRLVQANSTPGEIPFIRAVDSNNGVATFVSNTNNSMDSDVLGVNYDGSVCEAFYHPYKAIFSDSVKKLKLRLDLQNEYIYLFLKNIIINQKNKYNYAYKFNEKRMERQYIMLPINDEGEPDWNFMENYIKQIEDTQKEEYKAFALKKLQDLEYKEIPKLKEKQWQAFEIQKSFCLKRGKRLIESDRKSGTIPYYSASKSDNGLTDFISNPLFVEENKIIVTTFCDSYFISGKFTSSDEITMLSNDKINLYSGLFISKIISSNKEKYSFGRKAFTERISSQKIILPINLNNEPDYDYMEQYIKNVIHKQLSAYLATCK